MTKHFRSDIRRTSFLFDGYAFYWHFSMSVSIFHFHFDFHFFSFELNLAFVADRLSIRRQSIVWHSRFLVNLNWILNTSQFAVVWRTLGETKIIHVWFEYDPRIGIRTCPDGHILNDLKYLKIRMFLNKCVYHT